MTTKLIKKASKGYSYNYASLADIAIQAEDLPKMRVKPIDGNDYIEYYDPELKEWQIGAKVVVPEMKGSNAAQAYGAALSYARRYTALMALKLASDDDAPIELDITNIEEKLQQVDTIEQLNDIYSTIPQRYQNSIKPIFTKRKKELELLNKSAQVKQALTGTE